MKKKALKRTAWILGGLLLLLLGYVGYILILTGELRSLEPHFAGECHPIKGVVGAEDITFQPGGKMAYVSSDDRRAALAGNPGVGAIYGYFPGDRAPGRLVNLTPEPPGNFHPHGIGLLARPGAADLLFVISHPGAELFRKEETDGPVHTVELFELQGERLVHRRTFSDASMVSPNDVAPVGPESFYFTNDHGSGDLKQQMLEDFARLARSNLVYFDGKAGKVVAGGMRYANGVAVSRDLKRVFVAATTDRTVRTFDRADDGGLTAGGEIYLETGVDNLEFDAAGNLWVGAHPKLLSFMSHAGDASMRAPSHVLRLSPDGAGGWRPEEVLLSDGADLSASSVAAVHGQRMLVGAVFDPRFLDCRLP